VKVGLLEVLLEVDLVRLAEDLPIDVPDVVPERVRTVLRELDADALVGLAVHARHQAFDDQPGAQLEPGNARERARLKVPAVVRGFRG
jgi:hypothetical protein